MYSQEMLCFPQDLASLESRLVQRYGPPGPAVATAGPGGPCRWGRVVLHARWGTSGKSSSNKAFFPSNRIPRSSTSPRCTVDDDLAGLRKKYEFLPQKLFRGMYGASVLIHTCGRENQPNIALRNCPTRVCALPRERVFLSSKGVKDNSSSPSRPRPRIPILVPFDGKEVQLYFAACFDFGAGPCGRLFLKIPLLPCTTSTYGPRSLDLLRAVLLHGSLSPLRDPVSLLRRDRTHPLHHLLRPLLPSYTIPHHTTIPSPYSALPLPRVDPPRPTPPSLHHRLGSPCGGVGRGRSEPPPGEGAPRRRARLPQRPPQDRAAPAPHPAALCLRLPDSVR